MILIGSAAIKEYYPDFPRNPKDVDYAVDKPNIKSSKEIEYLYNPVLFNENIVKLTENQLLTLKASHLFWDINWDKHMFDCQFLIKKGHRIEKDLFYKLYDFWNEFHGKNKRSDLKMSSTDFFDNAINFPVEHDILHEMLITHPYFESQEKPIYTKILKGEVEVCEEKFNKLSFKEKKNLVLEEVMCMATERNFHKDYRFRYGRMLKKFIISHCPLFESIFIIENYLYLYKPEFNYLEYLEQKIKQQNGTNN